jgi:hypothetical protein
VGYRKKPEKLKNLRLPGLFLAALKVFSAIQNPLEAFRFRFWCVPASAKSQNRFLKRIFESSPPSILPDDNISFFFWGKVL